MIKLIKGDCLEKMKEIESGSVDLILTDLPYGTVKGAKFYDYAEGVQWDNILDFNKMWTEVNRVLRKNGKCILFGQEPFTSNLIKSAIPNVPFSYRNIWLKDHFANSFIAKKAPVNYYEDICVFSKNEDTDRTHPLRDYFYEEYEKTKLSYKEINRDYLKTTFNGGGGMAYNILSKSRLYFSMPTKDIYIKLQATGFFKKPYEELKEIDDEFKFKLASVFNLWQGKKYKSNVFEYKKDYDGFHPTQKPVLLLEDLIKTYSNENETVLDFTMGSGSTGEACLNTNRNFIGIEMDENYFNIAKERIKNHTSQQKLL